MGPLPERRPWRPLLLLAVVVGVSLLHYLTSVMTPGWHALYRWCYHLPIILAAFWYGRKGGVGMAVIVTFLYVPHVLLHWHGGSATQWLEISLYNVVGWVTGTLSQRQMDESDRYRRAAVELDRAYAELKERARVLVETEEQLRMADRLAALGRLSAGLAHEVKTPLASIRGTSEILATASDPAEREEFAGILVKEVDRLNRVVNRFLDFARPKSEPASSADLNEAVGEVVRLVRQEAERRKVEVGTALGGSLPNLAMDPEQLRQVILNLVMNGLQAIPDGGRLDLSTRRDGEAAVLVVSDTGPGIPVDIRDRVFDPFFTTRDRGTGLGLSIVRRILANHEAEIRVSDREGGGTEMVVEFRTAEGGHG